MKKDRIFYPLHKVYINDVFVPNCRVLKIDTKTIQIEPLIEEYISYKCNCGGDRLMNTHTEDCPKIKNCRKICDYK